jgi:hypothetical protein
MPIRITAADGRVHEFADDRASVTLGRHPSCDVVLAPELTAVAPWHLAFERKLGRYRLVMQAEAPAWVDGAEAFEGDELGPRVTVALGHPDGPTVVVETIEAAVALPPTEHYRPHRSAARTADAAGRRLVEVRRLTALLGAVVLAAGLVFAGVYLKDRRELGRLVQQAYGPAVGEDQLVAALRAAAGSVFLVAAKDRLGVTPFGTAFVAAPGVLATNAHVAEAIEALGDGVQLVVRRAGRGSADLPVTKVSLHPDYRRFEEAWRAYGPLAAGAGGEARRITDAGAYDVALLFVADPVALPPPLPLAPNADLLGLEPGDPVGYVGFPVESAALGGVNMDDPEAQLQVGRITALTDFFLVKAEPADRQLLQHSLPVQGGASGSPVLDRQGRVVGVLSGGNLVEVNTDGTRVPSGVGVNFAQRVDLLRELLSGQAERNAKAREAYWQRRLGRYQTEVDVQLQDWAGSHGLTAVPPPILQVDGRTGRDAHFDMPVFVYPYTPDRTGWYLFLASAPHRENIDMMVVEDTPRGPRLVGSDTAPDSYPGVEYAAEAGASLQVVVPGPPDTDLTLKVFYLPKR